MKRILLIFLLLLSYLGFSQMRFNGIFNHQKLYIQNPLLDDSSFCSDSVHVNGVRLNTDVKTSAYEINLESLGLHPGDSLEIIIFHKADCTPKVLNPGPINYGSKVEIIDLGMSKDALLQCELKGTDQSIISVEQYRWNKWMSISTDSLISLPCHFSFDVNPYLHSGENKFRLVSKALPSQRRFPSASVYFQGPERGKEYEYSCSKQIIVFVNHTLYQLYDDHGNLVKNGSGIYVSMKDVKYGTYYLNFDNRNVKIKHKKYR